MSSRMRRGDTPEAPGVHAGSQGGASSSGRPRVVLVDDEAPIRHAVARLLAFEPVHLVIASTGCEALERMAQSDTAVMLADYHLGDMDGVELLRQAREISPDTSRILFSGHVDVELIRVAVNAGEVYRFIAKPWNDDELILAVRHGVERWQLMRRNRDLHREAELQNRRLSRFAEELEAQVAARTAELEVRHVALSFSQDVLDRLPVAVVGLDPTGQVALVNTLAHGLWSDLVPGESRIDDLPAALRTWLASAMSRPHGGYAFTSPLGVFRCEILALDGRGMVLVAVPDPPILDDAL